jgi:hypothetical protein
MAPSPDYSADLMCIDCTRIGSRRKPAKDENKARTRRIAEAHAIGKPRWVNARPFGMAAAGRYLIRAQKKCQAKVVYNPEELVLQKCIEAGEVYGELNNLRRPSRVDTIGDAPLGRQASNRKLLSKTWLERIRE